MSKKRNRQPDANCEESEGSTESSADTANSESKCPHVPKSVNFNKIKKSLKKTGISAECFSCKKGENDSKTAEEENGSSVILWICLQCGHQGCGREEKRHAMEHYKKPYSDCHFLVVDNRQWNVWCYQCESKVAVTSRKKLQETVEFVKKSASMPPSILQNRIPGNQLQKESNDVDKKREKTLSNLPKVGGLVNLGNTCFFNAVLQCLAQTPFLVKVLEDLRLPGQKFVLPGGKHRASNNSEEIDLPPIEGTLEHWGNFTSILCKTLTEMHNCTGQQPYSPNELLNSFKKKTMQYMDGGQHDSHELLRHLLELVRNEDLRRYQSIILKEVGLSEKTNPDAVEESLKSRVKFYGNQASARLLGPELVFRGVLVSTLECLDCHHSSQSKEPFLDLSLPVMADKPQPPVLKRKNSGLEDNLEIMGSSVSQLPSKHQSRKEKRAARRNRRQESNSENNQNNVSENNGSILQSEESDADVEDNIEGESSSLLCEIGESGYSSEKNCCLHPSNSNSDVSMAESKLPNAEKKSLDKDNVRSSIGLEGLSGDCNGVRGISSGISRMAIGHESPARYYTREGECSVQSCLNQFTALELMSGSNKVTCDACTAREKKIREECKMVCTPSTKQYLISRVPAVLILHLKRFQAQRIDFRKVTKHVSFPVLLDLAPVCKGLRPRGAMYSLYAVVEHSGTIHGGHYVAYVKTRVPLSSDDPRWSFLPSKSANDTEESSGSSSSGSDSEGDGATANPNSNNIEPPPGKWYYVSDSRVTEVDESAVLQRQAYLLFYERIL